MCVNFDFNIPEWVCWIAQDKDGIWWGYQVEPNLSHQSWYENEVGNSVRLGKGAQKCDWVSTLRRVK
jgi:hypothetical protein